MLARWVGPGAGRSGHRSSPCRARSRSCRSFARPTPLPRTSTNAQTHWRPRDPAARLTCPGAHLYGCRASAFSFRVNASSTASWRTIVSSRLGGQPNLHDSRRQESVRPGWATATARLDTIHGGLRGAIRVSYSPRRPSAGGYRRGWALNHLPTFRLSDSRFSSHLTIRRPLAPLGCGKPNRQRAESMRASAPSS
jgi:hypothetical protein